MKWWNHTSSSHGSQKLQQGNILTIATDNVHCHSLSAVTEFLCLFEFCGVLMSSYKRLCFPLLSCALRQGRYIGVAVLPQMRGAAPGGRGGQNYGFLFSVWQENSVELQRKKCVLSKATGKDFISVLETQSLLPFYSWPVSLACTAWGGVASTPFVLFEYRRKAPVLGSPLALAMDT